jgi:carbamoyltransferase
MEALHQEGALTHRARFDSPHLGHGYESGEIWNEIDAFTRERPLVVKEAGDDVAAFLVERLSAGTVIGTFQGRLEMGPRALGNRSVLADPRSVSIKERINALLKGREYFVPFAPVVLEEDAPRLWDGSCDYPYMTMAVQASEFARRAVPAVVHVDGTLRPQVVTARTNSWLHALLRQCKQAWGVGVLVNTSFNRHGHPIVAAPRDALEHLANGWVDAVILDRWYVERLPD